MGGILFDGSVPGRLGRVLVVDDDDSVRRPLRLMLLKAGFEVVEAQDGEEAIRKLREGENPLTVDTILCDIRMPNIDGSEAILYFRREYPSIPIIVLTGYPDVQLATTLMKDGVRDFLVKPVTREHLLSVLATAVDHHRILPNQFVA